MYYFYYVQHVSMLRLARLRLRQLLVMTQHDAKCAIVWCSVSQVTQILYDAIFKSAIKYPIYMVYLNISLTFGLSELRHKLKNSHLLSLQTGSFPRAFGM